MDGVEGGEGSGEGEDDAGMSVFDARLVPRVAPNDPAEMHELVAWPGPGGAGRGPRPRGARAANQRQVDEHRCSRISRPLGTTNAMLSSAGASPLQVVVVVRSQSSSPRSNSAGASPACVSNA